MKNLFVTTFVFFSFYIVSAQSGDELQTLSDSSATSKNEIKLNATNLIIFSYLDGSYEYLINEESSFGIALLVSFSEDDVLDEYRTFSITPYYRQYFSNKYAKGFFVEGFAMLNSGEDSIFVDTFDSFSQPSQVRTENYTDFALGISVGGKFVTPRGFVVDIYLGIGRNLLGSSEFIDIVGRGGVSLGYRF